MQFANNSFASSYKTHYSASHYYMPLSFKSNPVGMNCLSNILNRPSPRTPVWNRTPLLSSSGWCAGAGLPLSQPGGAALCDMENFFSCSAFWENPPAGCWTHWQCCAAHLKSKRKKRKKDKQTKCGAKGRSYSAVKGNLQIAVGIVSLKVWIVTAEGVLLDTVNHSQCASVNWSKTAGAEMLEGGC